MYDYIVRCNAVYMQYKANKYDIGTITSCALTLVTCSTRRKTKYSQYSVSPLSLPKCWRSVVLFYATRYISRSIHTQQH